MLNYKYLIIFFFIFFSSLLEAQKTQIDSLKKLLNNSDNIADIYYQIAYYFHSDDYDSCIYYCHKSIKNTKKNDIENLTYVSLLCGVTYKETGKYDSALFYLKKAKELFSVDNYPIGVATCNNDIARLYQEIGDYDKALSFYLQSVNIFKTTEDTANLANVYSNIGELYTENNKYDEAISLFLLSKELYQKVKLRKGQAVIFDDIGTLYRNQKKYEEALQEFEKSAQIWKEEKKLKKLGQSYVKIADILLILNKNNEALDYYSKAHTLFSKIKLSYGIVQSLIGFGDYYFLEKEYKKAILYYKKALNKALEINSFKIKLSIYKKLYNAYKKLNYNNLALSALEKVEIIKDSIFNIEQAKNLNNLQIKYDLKEKENQINNLEENTKIQQLEIDKKISEAEKRKIILLLLIIVAIGLAMFALVFFYQFKQKTKLSKELLIRVDEREILLRELHHRVKNNLQIISSLLNLQKNYSQNISVDDILNISKNRISTMLTIHEKLYKSKNLKTINISEYINEITTNIVDSLNKNNKKIDLIFAVDEIVFEIDIAIPFGLILNELITNSIKHAFVDLEKPEITISGIKKENIITINYSDNGQGLSDNFDINKSNSLGMKLITGLTKQIKGEFIINKLNIGTMFTIKIIL